MKLTKSAQKLLNEITESGDLTRAADFNTRAGWDELAYAVMVNVWMDDTGAVFVEPGRQQ